MTFLSYDGRNTSAAKIWVRLTALATDSCLIFWCLCGWRRRDTAPGVLDRSLPDNMALRSDILAESRQKGAGNMSTEPVRMSRHVMWHERRAVQQKNRGRLSGKRGIFHVKRQQCSALAVGSLDSTGRGCRVLCPCAPGSRATFAAWVVPRLKRFPPTMISG